MLVLLPMLIDYSNGYVDKRSLYTAAKIKIIGEPSLAFTDCDLVSVSFRRPLENYKMVSWKKKEFEDLEDLLVSFKIYFVIAEDSLCIFTIYYLLL